MRSLVVTTSWDDGHGLDLKIADLLDRYDIRGTFYISRNYLKSRLTDGEIIKLSRRHEIGAHTVTHPVLPRIPIFEAEKEVSESKLWLETLLGSEIQMFCYPEGAYNKSIINVVRRAGFRGARTVERFRITRPSSSYEMNTTIHMYPLSPTGRGWLGLSWPPPVLRLLPSVRPPSPPPLLRDYLDMRKELRIAPYYLKDCSSLAKAIFDFSLRNGEVFHLWGHSWEVDEFDMWENLEDILKYISGRRECTYATNGETLVQLGAAKSSL